jgi:hypothetical protein
VVLVLVHDDAADVCQFVDIVPALYLPVTVVTIDTMLGGVGLTISTYTEPGLSAAWGFAWE